jgi:CheY-like chemotaxis protein
VARILIVEDEPDIRFMMRLILQSAGHHVTEAKDGAAGLMLIKSAPPDLVITDVMMPGMNGLDFIERLRSDPNSSAIPILVVSANSELPTAANARIGKPFLAQELVGAAALLIRETGG